MPPMCGAMPAATEFLSEGPAQKRGAVRLPRFLRPFDFNQSEPRLWDAHQQTGRQAGFGLRPPPVCRPVCCLRCVLCAGKSGSYLVDQFSASKEGQL